MRRRRGLACPWSIWRRWRARVTGEAIPLAAQGGHDLGYEGLETLEAQADPILCAELLRNLVDNALRYAGPGARITVRSGMAAEGAFVEVEDDGPGIPPDRLPGLTLRRDLRADRDAGGAWPWPWGGGRDCGAVRRDLGLSRAGGGGGARSCGASSGGTDGLMQVIAAGAGKA